MMDAKQGEDSSAKASILAVNSLIYTLQPVRFCFCFHCLTTFF
jgi:hypothetical protein